MTSLYDWRNTSFHDIPGHYYVEDLHLSAETINIWSHLWPFVHIFPTREVEPHLYWKKIRSFVSNLYYSADIPDPMTQIHSFILFLLSNRSCLEQMSISHFVGSFRDLKVSTRSHFAIYVCPMLTVNPLMYMETVMHMIDTRNSILTVVNQSPALSEAFINFHMSFLTPCTARNESAWKYRILVSEILSSFVLSSLKNGPRTVQNGLKLLDLLNAMISSCQFPSYRVIMARQTYFLIKPLSRKTTKDNIHARALHFMQSLHATSFSMMLRAFASMSTPIITKKRMHRLILHRKIRTIQNIEDLLYITEESTALTSIMELSRLICFDKILRRAAAHGVRHMIIHFSGRTDVKQWVTMFVERLFVFLSLANQKYRIRSLFFTEFLSSLMSIKLLWIQQVVMSYSSSLTYTKQIPSNFKFFFASRTPVDDTFISDFEAFSASDVHLKHFPFDDDHIALVVLPNNDNYSKPLQSQRSVGRRESTLSGRRLQPQKKIDRLIKKPSSATQIRPLVSSIYITPSNRR